jgi:osomolarity two-component system phosphorelay intermediate protein YPD1
MSPTTNTPSADLRISPKAKIIDSKPKAPGLSLARAPSPTVRSIPTSPVTDKKFDKESAEAIVAVSKQSPPIDEEVFDQILDLDDDDTHDFSRDMVWAYFSQVKTTFKDMDVAFDSKDLTKLSSLGHFLKGSSAALGVQKVQASCEFIQHYGQLHDPETVKDITSEVALAKIGPLLSRVRTEYAAAEEWLRNWFRVNAGGDYDPTKPQ